MKILVKKKNLEVSILKGGAQTFYYKDKKYKVNEKNKVNVEIY